METQTKRCEFCLRKQAPERAENIHVCDHCWKLLKDPKTALPMIRGNLMVSLRGTVSEPQLQKWVNAFMEMIAKWQPRN